MTYTKIVEKLLIRIHIRVLCFKDQINFNEPLVSDQIHVLCVFLS